MLRISSASSSGPENFRLHAWVRHARFVLIATLASGIPSLAWAEAVIEGRVTLTKSHATPVMNKRYEIITKGGILSTNPPLAVVYLEGEFPKSAQPPVKQVTQKDMTFVPMLLPIQTGTRVEFPNLDDTYHNIFSYSPVKRFDLGRYRPDERPIPSVTFDQSGLVVLRCDIHEHMRGLILVIDGPHFVLTDAEGHYRLEGLPTGQYKLKVWLDSRTTLERSIKLEDGMILHADFP